MTPQFGYRKRPGAISGMLELRCAMVCCTHDGAVPCSKRLTTDLVAALIRRRSVRPGGCGTCHDAYLDALDKVLGNGLALRLWEQGRRASCGGSMHSWPLCLCTRSDQNFCNAGRRKNRPCRQPPSCSKPRRPIVLNNWKFIGTRKPTCGLCNYYFSEHPDNMVVRTSHSTLNPGWRLPDAFENQAQA